MPADLFTTLINLTLLFAQLLFPASNLRGVVYSKRTTAKTHTSLHLINLGNRYFAWNKLSQSITWSPDFLRNHLLIFYDRRQPNGYKMTRMTSSRNVNHTLFQTHATSCRRAAVLDCLMSWVRNANQRHRRRMLEFCIIWLITLQTLLHYKKKKKTLKEEADVKGRGRCLFFQ